MTRSRRRSRPLDEMAASVSNRRNSWNVRIVAARSRRTLIWSHSHWLVARWLAAMCSVD
jgi:hypothetical protein